MAIFLLKNGHLFCDSKVRGRFLLTWGDTWRRYTCTRTDEFYTEDDGYYTKHDGISYSILPGGVMIYDGISYSML